MTLAEALRKLRPGAQYNIRSSTYEGLEWLGPNEPPSREEVEAMLALQAPACVQTLTIVQRLSESGLLVAASAVLEQNIELKARFYTAGFIYSDNEEARAFLVAIGADPDAILAP